MKNIARILAALLLAFVMSGLTAPAEALPGYDGCPANQAHIAIRLSGNASTYPSCNLARCVTANPNQRVKLYNYVGFPPAWQQVAEYRSHFGAQSSSAPACPSYVENAAWLP